MPEAPNGIEFRDRDFTLLRGLFECRVMTSDRITRLYFEGHAEAAKKRLRWLKHAKVIHKRPRLRYQPAIPLLSARGFRLLHDNGSP